MGSRSASSSSSSQQTNTQNLNLQGIEGVAVAGVDGNVRIETTDQGTVAAARDIALEAFDSGYGAFRDAVDLAGDVAAGAGENAQAALNFARDTQGDVFDFASDSQAESFALAGDVTRGFQEEVGSLADRFIGAGERLVSDVIEFARGTSGQLVDATAAIQARESGNTDARLEGITRAALIGGAVLAGVAILAAVSR